MSKRIVHIVGTGTIGEPLIGLFSSFKDELGVDEVTFHKRSPLSHERAKVNSMVGRGAKLAVDEERVGAFEDLGHRVSFTANEAIARATAVIDCTPVGNQLKPQYEAISGPRVYLAQGSESGFGIPYARGINDQTLDLNQRFVQVVSCNTHNICALLKTIGEADGRKLDIKRGRFVCLRRASDISEAGNSIPSPEVGTHPDPRFGTHHAQDAWRVFDTLGADLDLFSSAVKLPTQYMHVLHFSIETGSKLARSSLMAALANNPRIALTEKRLSSQVFSFGRDHGFAGRLLNQAVLPNDALHLDQNEHVVTGWCFTPQDGNSLLSSLACSLAYIHGEDPGVRLEAIRPYMFDEI